MYNFSSQKKLLPKTKVKNNHLQKTDSWQKKFGLQLKAQASDKKNIDDYLTSIINIFYSKGIIF